MPLESTPLQYPSHQKEEKYLSATLELNNPPSNLQIMVMLYQAQCRSLALISFALICFRCLQIQS